MLLFLHGFLGCKGDWDSLLSHLKKGMAIDLPIEDADIALSLKQRFGKIDALIGYSAGGRIALEIKDRFPESVKKVIAISTHPGLSSAEEKKKRREWDKQWVYFLKVHPFSTFLEKWYAQPLFSSLKTSPHFEKMLRRRERGNPKAWAYFLNHYGLGQKEVQKPISDAFYIYGSEDLKYASLYRKLNSFEVKNCGHAVHIEQPQACAQLIERLIHDDI